MTKDENKDAAQTSRPIRRRPTNSLISKLNSFDSSFSDNIKLLKPTIKRWISREGFQKRLNES